MKSLKFSLSFLVIFFSLSVKASPVDYSKQNPFIQKYQYGSQSHTESQFSQQSREAETSTNKQVRKTTKVNKSKYVYLQKHSHELRGCWDSAGRQFNVDPWLLFAIANVESSFNANAINKNSNSSIDIGIMQINSFWFPILAKKGIYEKDLISNPCLSVHVGAWILSQGIERFGYNIDGIGAYNSPNNKTLRRNYGRKVIKSYQDLTNDFSLN